MSRCLNESCGLIGVYDFDDEEVVSSLYWGMISQNHRGHQSYGLLTWDGEFKSENGLGLLPVEDGHSDFQFENLTGSVGIGHVRYATSGDKDKLWRDIQPFVDEHEEKKIAIGYNGNLVNNSELRKELDKKFNGLSSTSDTELLCKKLLEGFEHGDLPQAVRHCMKDIEGSFSVVGIDSDGRLFAFRDPMGIKPLCYGRTSDRELYAISSESVGLSINGLEYQGEVKPGELLVFSDEGFERERIVDSDRRAFCSFEYDYFARPDAILNEKPVYKIREEFGRNLGRENPDITEKADLIVSIPQTADDAAYGLHMETGMPWERAIRKHRYVTSRAFISSSDKRDEVIDKKINVDWSKIREKNVAIAEDSIVRGTTSRRVVRKMKRVGVGNIHLYVTFPRIIAPCFYGIDMTTYDELIGSDHTPEEIAEEIGVSSVNYQSIENFVKATGLSENELCLGCVTEDYPTPLAQKMAGRYKAKFESGENKSSRIYERVENV